MADSASPGLCGALRHAMGVRNASNVIFQSKKQRGKEDEGVSHHCEGRNLLAGSEAAAIGIDSAGVSDRDDRDEEDDQAARRDAEVSDLPADQQKSPKSNFDPWEVGGYGEYQLGRKELIAHEVGGKLQRGLQLHISAVKENGGEPEAAPPVNDAKGGFFHFTMASIQGFKTL